MLSFCCIFSLQFYVHLFFFVFPSFVLQPEVAEVVGEWLLLEVTEAVKHKVIKLPANPIPMV